ncbi:hypothetical protein PsorP6_006398 [Peronosclerospora sorghi]|uniref:Uncharacterized protein n=1 Tax=Peronosclerospora sorghi TaxID=230839 RepID=A0ACC0W1H6_9STRA|nr:hypothetical protein PsorP6_006398 [Peronosclerospora sorghi]
MSMSPHDSEKADRFKQQSLGSDGIWCFGDNYRTPSRPSAKVLNMSSNSSPALNPTMYLSGDRAFTQRKVIHEWTKNMIKSNIIHPSTSPFSAPSFA